jgi:hypothetical protein
MATTQKKPSEVLMAAPAGISWTAPDKSRPWQNPPKYVKLTDVIQFYMAVISSEDISDDLLDTLETKLPLSVIAEGMMLTNVDKGIHTIDAGILAMPIMMEMMKTIAMIHGVDVKDYNSDYDKEETMSPRVMKQAIDKVFKTIKEPVEEVKAVEEKAVPVKGLMARNIKQGV